MKEPTVALQGSSLGDALGIGWFLRDVDGVRTVGHAGSANGQFAEFLTVPEQGFAVAALSNAGPTASPSTRPSYVGHSRPTWAWSTGSRNRSRTTRRGPAKSSEV